MKLRCVTSGRSASPMMRFYSGRTAFVTGGTGFLGKSLIEKLLRSCDISKVYLLMRPKKGKKINERLQELLNDSVFDVLRDQDPDFVTKLIPIAGEVSQLKLGINVHDWDTLTREVEVIFHEAATTRFDEALKQATLINVRGARECLNLGKACKKLCAYIHVSTAYAHCTTKLIDNEVHEKFYRSPMSPDVMISLAEEMKDDNLTAITAELIKDWPNTYTFTKALSEELIRTTSGGLPICIVRPAIVISALRDPIPGWIDSSAVYGASGFVLGVALGVLHVIWTDGDKSNGFIPCDYVTNTALAAGREAAVSQMNGGEDTKIYAVTPTNRNRVTLSNHEKLFHMVTSTLATPLALYYNFRIYVKNIFTFAIASLLVHLIPAYIADFMCLLMWKERRFVKMAKKVNKMTISLSYFMRNEWLILDHNTSKLYEGLSEQDKVVFNFNITDINWEESFTLWDLGVRKYILKDGLAGTEYGCRKQKSLWYVHYFLVVPTYAYFLWKVFYYFVNLVSSLVILMFY